jgi:hypothetical protein
MRTDLDSTWVPGDDRTESERLNVGALAKEGAHHTPESFLPCGVPQLQTDFDAIHVCLLGHEKCAARRGGVLGVELVLCVALEEAGLADTWDGAE